MLQGVIEIEIEIEWWTLYNIVSAAKCSMKWSQPASQSFIKKQMRLYERVCVSVSFDVRFYFD